jgi:hypothetical protein
MLENVYYFYRIYNNVLLLATPCFVSNETRQRNLMDAGVEVDRSFPLSVFSCVPLQPDCTYSTSKKSL